MKKYVLPTLIAISAISISATAAFYSITGLSQLFAGAALAVIIMASALELSKLVMASLLYQFRKTLPKLLKIYLTIATIVLILITSMGIYGFLSNAFMQVAQQSEQFDNKVLFIEDRKSNIKDRLDVLIEEKQSLNLSSQELRTGISSNKIQYKDRETGKIITTTSSANRKVLQDQLTQIQNRENIIDKNIDSLNNIYFSLNDSINSLKLNNNIAAELGPLLYISEVTNTDMKNVVNWLILIIVLVFDPLAISLVVAANFAFEKVKNKVNSKFNESQTLISNPKNIIPPKIEENSNSQNLKEKKTNPITLSTDNLSLPINRSVSKDISKTDQYHKELEQIRRSNLPEYKKRKEAKDLKRRYF